jgi:hypothetical protein
MALGNAIILVIAFAITVGYLGFEPRAYRLKAEYSTIELVTLFKKIINYIVINIPLS